LLFAQEVVFPPVQRCFVLPPLGRETLSFHLYQANIFEKKQAYYLDLEETRLTVNISFPVAKAGRVYLYLPFIYTGGGVMDGAIDGFHRLFGLPDGGRGQVPYGRNTYLLFARDLARRGPLVGEPEVFFSYGGYFKIILGGKIPLKNDGFRSGRSRVFLGGSLEGKAGSLYFKSTLGLAVAAGKSSFFTSRMEARWRRLDFGLLVRTSPYTAGDLSHAAVAAFAAVRIYRGVKIGMVEDMAPYDTSADFTLYLSVDLSTGGN